MSCGTSITLPDRTLPRIAECGKAFHNEPPKPTEDRTTNHEAWLGWQSRPQAGSTLTLEKLAI